MKKHGKTRKPNQERLSKGLWLFIAVTHDLHLRKKFLMIEKENKLTC